MDILNRIYAFYAAHYLNTSTYLPELAAAYGWLATASFVGLLATLLFVLFQREQAKVFVAILTQNVFIVGLPWLLEPLAAALGL